MREVTTGGINRFQLMRGGSQKGHFKVTGEKTVSHIIHRTHKEINNMDKGKTLHVDIP